MTAHEVKIGDRVVLKNGWIGGVHIVDGCLNGVVVAKSERETVFGVQFEREFDGGHACGNYGEGSRGEPKRCWNFWGDSDIAHDLYKVDNNGEVGW